MYSGIFLLYLCSYQAKLLASHGDFSIKAGLLFIYLLVSPLATVSSYTCMNVGISITHYHRIIQDMFIYLHVNVTSFIITGEMPVAELSG